MSAADKREELEARCWHEGLTLTAVQYILNAADAYAEALADEYGPERVVGRVRLAQAAAEAVPVHYHGEGAGATACQFTWRRPPRRVTSDPRKVSCTRCRKSRGYKDDMWAREHGEAA